MKNGFFDPIFSVIQDHPSVAAGTITFAVAFSLVAGNAFFAQSGTHPEPIWATRDATFTHSIEKTLRPVETSVIKPRTMPVPQSREAAAPKAKPSEVVAAVQKALIATGDFNGEIDGLMGPVTRASIIAYQKRNGFEQTGNASKLLLTAIEQDLPKITRSSDKLSGLIANSSNGSTREEFDKELVRQIQAGLANRGLNIGVDGLYGSKTRAAIEAFQKKHGLEVTGRPDPAVLQTLKQVGAFTQG